MDIDLRGGLTDAVTPHAGVALLLELGRRSGTRAAAERHLPAKQSRKGLAPAQFVEAFVVRSALGGDGVDDCDGRRRDRGLAALLGYDLPAASPARPWRERFPDAAVLAARPRQGSFLPAESAARAGLGAVVPQTVRAQCTAVPPAAPVTLDVDAHRVESSKPTALPPYEGDRGDPPLLVRWAETGLVLAAQFRDGTVPASRHSRELVAEASAQLPAGAWGVSVRSDSAAYEPAPLDHWDARGWRFAVSADLSPQRRDAIGALPPDAWQAWATEANGVVREWAEVPEVPSRGGEQRPTPPDRQLAIRVRTRPGGLFGDGSPVQPFAVGPNDWDPAGPALLAWQRGKAGPIEHGNYVLKDERAAGVDPSHRFGANAAWLRLPGLTPHWLELLKATALDAEYRRARPKRLRFALFTQFGRVVRHAREQFLRVVTRVLTGRLRPGLRRRRAGAWPTGP